MRIKLINIKRINILLLTVFLGLINISYAGMANYCTIPPFLKAEVKPTVVMVMDYSGSMQFPAYYPCNWGTPYYYRSYVAECASRGRLVSANYDNTTVYYGLFKSEACYEYDTEGSYWIESTCDCSDNDGIGNVECLNGNFLNWATTTRIDAALKALIGGKAICTDTECILKSQGSRRGVYDSNLDCVIYLEPEEYDSTTPSYRDKTVYLSIFNGSESCVLGEVSGRAVNVKIPASEYTGVIQESFDDIRITFMVFGGDDVREGEIRYAFYQNDLNALVAAIQNEIPYYGTPTGEALWEAYDYLRQSNDNWYESNTEFMDIGTEKDPYYEVLESGDIVPASCRNNYVLLISDGLWNGDIDPDRPANTLHTTDLRPDLSDEQKAKVFSLYIFNTDVEGIYSMKTISAHGSFDDTCSNDNYPYDLPGLGTNSRDVEFPRPHCDPDGTYRDCCEEWDKDNDGIPDTFFQANNGAEIEVALRKIFGEVKKGATSGTVIAAQTAGKGKGSIINHAASYPKKTFGNVDLTWIGALYTYWFFNSKYAQNVRDNTQNNDGRIILDVYNPAYDESKSSGQPITENDYYDFILMFDTDEEGNIVANLYESELKGELRTDVAGDPVLAEYTPNPIPSIEETHYLWEAGEELALTDGSYRDIFVAVSPNSIVPFDIPNKSSFAEFLGDVSFFPSCIPGNSENAKINNLIRYIRGERDFRCRSRKFNDGRSRKIWKLGDIMHSSPAIVQYDYSYYNGSIVFIGANDGMLHAFEAGKIKRLLTKYQVAELVTDYTEKGLGKELWAFIPKNVLPYLRYLPDPDYCHIYYVDQSPYIIYLDKDITDLNEKPDRIILIGGLRLGGACGCTGTNCVNPPSDTCSDPTSSDCVGRSSYFALDITNPLSPRLLWEFSDKDLGFSFSGPGVIKILDGTSQKAKVLFASGPTDYKGLSAQNLKLFILDAESGRVDTVIDTGISEAFGGRIHYEGLDINNDGNTDYLFLGYTKGSSISTQSGGVLAIKTSGGYSVTDLTPFIDPEMLPVVTSVMYMDCYNVPYIYFGTGKWFYKEDNPQPTKPNKIYGIPLNCDSTECSVLGSVYNISDSPVGVCNYISTSRVGWYRELDLGSGSYMKEKNLASPSVTNFGAVFFSTSQPNLDICSVGGRHRIWHFNCATGAPITYNCDAGYYVTSNYTLLYSDTGGRINQETKPDDTTDDFSTTGNTGWKEHLVVGGQNPQTAFTPGGEILLWLER
ncbi:pilus assembly protein [Persephonella sp.]